jgi:uncharacterized protein YndB with AHSA1/START domain
MVTTTLQRTETMTVYVDGEDLVYERSFDAPRDLVWRAFTDANLIPRWWGKHGTTTRVEALDVRPGGAWRFVNGADDRDEIAFYGTFLDVHAPERFRWTFLFDIEGMGEQGGEETHVFEATDAGRTKVVARSHIGPPEAIEAALATGMIEGAIETWDRLETLLTEL